MSDNPFVEAARKYEEAEKQKKELIEEIVTIKDEIREIRIEKFGSCVFTIFFKDKIYGRHIEKILSFGMEISNITTEELDPYGRVLVVHCMFKKESKE